MKIPQKVINSSQNPSIQLVCGICLSYTRTRTHGKLIVDCRLLPSFTTEVEGLSFVNVKTINASFPLASQTRGYYYTPCIGGLHVSSYTLALLHS